MQALQFQYSQSRQLVQREIAAISTGRDVKPSNGDSTQNFALKVHLPVSMLFSFEGSRGMELNCCSNIDCLLGKLPNYYRDGFIEFLQLRGKLNTPSLNRCNL